MHARDCWSLTCELDFSAIWSFEPARAEYVDDQDAFVLGKTSAEEDTIRRLRMETLSREIDIFGCKEVWSDFLHERILRDREVEQRIEIKNLNMAMHSLKIMKRSAKKLRQAMQLD